MARENLFSRSLVKNGLYLTFWWRTFAEESEGLERSFNVDSCLCRWMLNRSVLLLATLVEEVRLSGKLGASYRNSSCLVGTAHSALSHLTLPLTLHQSSRRKKWMIVHQRAKFAFIIQNLIKLLSIVEKKLLTGSRNWWIISSFLIAKSYKLCTTKWCVLHIVCNKLCSAPLERCKVGDCLAYNWSRQLKEVRYEWEIVLGHSHSQ